MLEENKKYNQGTFLKKINSPSDLRKIKINDLSKLSAELRKFIIEIVSEKGGHFGASLGAVSYTHLRAHET